MLRRSPIPLPTSQNGTWCFVFRTLPISATTVSYSPKLDGTEHALDGNHFSHLYTQSPYKYFGRTYTSNAVGDVLTIEAIELEKETTAYIGNVEGAYPVPDIERLTDDLQVRAESPTWSAGANHVDIGTFQGVPDTGHVGTARLRRPTRFRSGVN